MSAPSSSRLPLLAALLLFAAVVASGCTVPGSGRLYRAPKALPPSLDYVTADIMGFSLFDTDPGSKLWAPFGEGVAKERLAAMQQPVFGDESADGWIGRSAGVALRELDLDGSDETSTLWFADVARRPKLERALREAGWKRRTDDLESPAKELTLWTRGEPGCDEPDGGEFAPKCFTLGPTYHALALADDAAIAAESTKALRTFLRAARSYRVSERRSMSEYAVEARRRTPASFVTRFDLIRTQLRRPFERDPATLEFARWATDSNTLVALRDGWLGIAPPIDRGADDGLRVVGASEWVPDLAPDLDMKPVKRELLERLAPDVDVAVALRDPGQQLRELVRAITFGSGQYVTEQDVPKDERVDLLPTLDELDGDAAVGWQDGVLLGRVEVDDPETTTKDVNRALDAAKLDGSATATDSAVVVSVGATRPRRVPSTNLSAPLDAAGTPPRPPVLWLWKRGDACVGDAAGWVTFDDVDELRLSMSVSGSQNPSCPQGLSGLARSLGLW